MRNMILEYASSVIAVLGTVGFLSMMGYFFLGKNGMLAALIIAVLGGIYR